MCPNQLLLCVLVFLVSQRCGQWCGTRQCAVAHPRNPLSHFNLSETRAAIQILTIPAASVSEWTPVMIVTPSITLCVGAPYRFDTVVIYHAL